MAKKQQSIHQSAFFLLTFFMFCSLPQAFAGVSGENFEFSGYIRVGSGINNKGGDQVCFNNSGASALNEFRLGNECSIYSETAFTAYHLRGETADDPYFKTQVRWAMTPPGHSPWEHDLVNLFEVFMEAGNLHGRPFKYWVGKRIYRDADVYLLDWYYFADMSGNGAGIYDIPLGSGRLALAHIIQVKQSREDGSFVTTESDIGRHNSRFFDLRWNDVDLATDQTLNFWVTYGMAPGGIAEDGTEYVDADGYAVGIRHRWNMANGFNDLALMYGKRLVEGLSLWGNPAITGVSAQHGKWRARLVEHLTLQPSDKWAFHLVGAYEERDAGCIEESGVCTDQLTGERWTSLGIRPVWFITKHFQLAFEAGHSIVDYDREDEARILTRFALAPQIAIGPNIWGRPILRAFFAHSSWNEGNEPYPSEESFAYQNETSGWNYGFHAEVWF